MAPTKANDAPNLVVESRRIKEATLHVRLPLKKRGYVAPFIIAYSIWMALCVWLSAKGWWDELFFVPLALIVLFHGLAILSCQWSVRMDTWLTCRPAKGIEEAQLVKIIPTEHSGKAALVAVERPELTEQLKSKSTNDKETIPRWIYFQRQKFTWDEDRKIFRKLCFPIHLPRQSYITAKGLEDEEKVREATNYYGLNRFDMPLPTFLELFKEHAVAPFFVFQVFCVALWCMDEYWYYSVFTLVMLVVFESTVVQQRLRNLAEFRSMSLPSLDVAVKRGGSWKKIKSEGLLPGDLVILEMSTVTGEDLTLPCDLVLVGGTCIINEAMISGESTPLLKEPLLFPPGEMEEPLNLATDRNHLLFGGTKVLQITSPSAEMSISKTIVSSPNFCIGFVIRTGFSTMQGKLVRTMMFSSERMTANNWEAFAFILFLLIFALAAAGYVLYHGWGERSHLKLLLECALIVTAVVPPELPMELSLAVNNALLALSKYAIYCMEPFRIPWAGKLDVCCFDKTGTLTGENLVVEGVAGLTSDESCLAKEGKDCPLETNLVIATCHGLFRLRSQPQQQKQSSSNIVGDPMEKTALEFVNWNIVEDSSDNLFDQADSRRTARVLHRFPFSSALKRMSCVIQASIPGSQHRSSLMVTCKGAPEVIEGMLKEIPSGYRQMYGKLAHRGARVLALAYRSLTSISVAAVKDLNRDQVERDLHFAGFLVFHCPLKRDSRRAVASLQRSLHHVVMITGDNVLTAVHTAYELRMLPSDICCGIVEEKDKCIRVSFFDPTTPSEGFANDNNNSKDILNNMEVIAITGDAFSHLLLTDAPLLKQILTRIIIFARASPSQKEDILTTYKTAGLTTLMCGDGTNDVGALKQAHVGVALLDGRPEDLSRILKQSQTVAMRKRQLEWEKSRLALEQRFGPSAMGGGGDQTRLLQERIQNLTRTLEEEEIPMVRLGDASVAAPFTSKLSTIEAVVNIVRQGRCTLVTTMQMYKILALNSLISAYGLSVLHLEGIRYGDFQVTITGMLLAGCFLFLTKSRPVQKLAPARPQPNIFNWYVLISVLGQFLLHVLVLAVVLSGALRWSFRMPTDPASKFSPGLVNTAVYLVSLLMQVSTFLVNYQGRPFRESLSENGPLRSSLLAVGGIATVAALELYPEFNEWLQLVPMPPAFKWRLVTMMVVDLGGCLFIEWLCKRLFFDARPRIQQLATKDNE